MTPRAACGTDRGYQLHRAAGEQACDDCRHAHSEQCAKNRAIRAARTHTPTCACGRRIVGTHTTCRLCREAAQRTATLLGEEPDIRWTLDTGGIWRGEIINDPDPDTTRNGSWRVT